MPPPALISELVALVAPPACPACRVALGSARLRLCPGCAAALPWLPGGCCPRCALPAHRGRRCPAAAAAFGRAWAPLAYQGVARDLVAALKFRAALPLADLMAAHIAANLPPDLRARVGGGEALELAAALAPRQGRPLPGALAPWEAPPPVAIVAVPPQRMRLRRRGFDPAGALATSLAERLGVPLAACLARRDRARRQVGTSRAQRRRAGRISIEAHAQPPPRVLLVDDVHTTGSTLEACARALRAAGCRDIAAVTYARTL